MADHLDERGVTERRISWSAGHATDWEEAIRRGDRRTARELYEELGTVLREEMREEGGNPVLSDPATNERIRARLARMRASGGFALDLGCGPTPVAAMTLREAGFRPVAVDVAHSICAIAKETAGDGVDVVVADAEHLPFRDEVFEAVTCDDTIEHIFDQGASAAELGRTVRAGGRMLVVTPNASGMHVQLAKGRELVRGRRQPRERYHITQSHVRELRWHELVRLFRPWFGVRHAEPIGFAGTGRRAKLLNRVVELPGMWRLGWTLFVELERVRGQGEVGRHYAQLDDPDSQTSPAVVRKALRDFAASAEGPVLDLGTGGGDNLRVITASHRAVGVDVSLDAARRAVAIAPVVVCDAAHLPFRDASFGTVVCTEVLEHLDDPGAALGEAARVLRPGGRAFVTSPNYLNLAGAHKLIADRRSGTHDWNPWGAHEGGYEATMTGRRLLSLARPHFRLERARGLDYGQAITGRFRPLDRLAWTRTGQRFLRRLLPRLEGSTGPLAWVGMHTELVLRKDG